MLGYSSDIGFCPGGTKSTVGRLRLFLSGDHRDSFFMPMQRIFIVSPTTRRWKARNPRAGPG